MKKAVVLLSGGVDSSVAAYIAKKDVGKRGELYAITFDYGQRHGKEVDCAMQIGVELGLSGHSILVVTIPRTGSSLFANAKEEIRTTGVEPGIPDTWVPQRNSIFLTLAFAYAEIKGADYVYTGFNVVDYSGYPDCRPEFVEAINKGLNLASKRFVETGKGIGIICPLMHKHKYEIVQIGMKLGVPFEKTWSCYKGGERACGLCDSCRFRLEAFRKAGFEDPIEYQVEEGTITGSDYALRT